MTILKISAWMLEDMLFHGRKARIVGATMDDYNIYLEIEGEDVPTEHPIVGVRTVLSQNTTFEPIP